MFPLVQKRFYGLILPGIPLLTAGRKINIDLAGCSGAKPALEKTPGVATRLAKFFIIVDHLELPGAQGFVANLFAQLEICRHARR